MPWGHARPLTDHADLIMVSPVGCMPYTAWTVDATLEFKLVDVSSTVMSPASSPTVSELSACLYPRAPNEGVSAVIASQSIQDLFYSMSSMWWISRNCCAVIVVTASSRGKDVCIWMHLLTNKAKSVVHR